MKETKSQFGARHNDLEATRPTVSSKQSSHTTKLNVNVNRKRDRMPGYEERRISRQKFVREHRPHLALFDEEADLSADR